MKLMIFIETTTMVLTVIFIEIAMMKLMIVFVK